LQECGKPHYLLVMIQLAGYLTLFAVAFVAATILPVQSEVVLGGMQVSGAFSLPLLVTVATAGNTLGAVVNWWMGAHIERYRDSRWFPVKPDGLERARLHYSKWGRWGLLFSWLPFGGDALTVIAGVMKEPLMPFLLLVGVGKLVRYLVLVGAVASIW
jgi:membrane protein YqaA with SNARE-associated domain